MEFDLINDLEITHNPGSSKKKGVKFFFYCGGGGGFEQIFMLFLILFQIILSHLSCESLH